MMCFLGGCISGSKKVISEIRYMHHILGGTLNPTGVSSVDSVNILMLPTLEFLWNLHWHLNLVILFSLLWFTKIFQNASYLIIHGLKTLHLCVQQQNTTAMRMIVVQFLECLYARRDQPLVVLVYNCVTKHFRCSLY